MPYHYIRVEDVRRAASAQPLPLPRFVARLYLDGSITKKIAERAHHEHCGRERAKALANGSAS